MSEAAPDLPDGEPQVFFPPVAPGSRSKGPGKTRPENPFYRRLVARTDAKKYAPRRRGGGLRVGNTVGAIRHPELEMMLEVFLLARQALYDEDKVPTNRGFTQEEIADVCGVSRGTIYNIEKKAMAKLRVRATRLLQSDD